MVRTRELAGGAELAADHPPQQLERERRSSGWTIPLDGWPTHSSRRQPVIVSNAGLRDAMGLGGQREDDVAYAFDERR